MHRFYVTGEQLLGGCVRFNPVQVRQIVRVLRMGVGSRVLAFNGSGQEWEVEIATASPREVVGRLVAEVSMPRESPLRIVLLQGLLKGDKMDYLIQKVTEMGVAEVVLLSTRRTVAQGSGRVARWSRIALEAAEQSGRLTIPRLTGPYRLEELEEYVAGPPPGVAMVLWEEERVGTFAGVLDQTPPPDEIRILVGPEGGLETGEVALLRGIGFVPVSLGPRTLRAETAAVAALAVLQHRWGDLR
ncbi:MAG: 16S rRNA (uracil(1498)-N(3))-methyltransferase [Candidatus Methylomirabilales bacterium]